MSIQEPNSTQKIPVGKIIIKKSENVFVLVEKFMIISKNTQ